MPPQQSLDINPLNTIVPMTIAICNIGRGSFSSKRPIGSPAGDRFVTSIPETASGRSKPV
jgi:hypothetical protein